MQCEKFYALLFKFRLERERRECEKRRKVFLAVSGDDDPRQIRIRLKREYGVVGAVAEKNAQIEPGDVFLYRSGERTGRAVRIGKYYYLQG